MSKINNLYKKLITWTSKWAFDLKTNSEKNKTKVITKYTTIHKLFYTKIILFMKKTLVLICLIVLSILCLSNFIISSSFAFGGNSSIELSSENKIKADKVFIYIVDLIESSKYSKEKQKEIYLGISKIVEKRKKTLTWEKALLFTYLGELIDSKLYYLSDLNKEKYSIIYQEQGIKFLQSEDKNISIIDLDLDKYWVSFWWLKRDWNFYKKYYANELLSVLNNENIFATINWQFFLDIKSERSGLSFPVKSYGNIFTDYVDNEIEKRTLIITKENKAFIKDWYNKEDLEDSDNSEVVVAFDPEAFHPRLFARQNSKIWRSFVWLKGEKNVIFFIAKKLTQKEMKLVMESYWISEKDIIMFDWGGSSQFATKLEDTNYYGWRKVPHFNFIYKR